MSFDLYGTILLDGNRKGLRDNEYEDEDGNPFFDENTTWEDIKENADMIESRFDYDD